MATRVGRGSFWRRGDLDSTERFFAAYLSTAWKRRMREVGGGRGAGEEGGAQEEEGERMRGGGEEGREERERGECVPPSR